MSRCEACGVPDAQCLSACCDACGATGGSAHVPGRVTVRPQAVTVSVPSYWLDQLRRAVERADSATTVAEQAFTRDILVSRARDFVVAADVEAAL